MKSLLLENKIQVGAFCAPQPKFTGKDGIEFPSRVTEEIYRKIAELGVTVVYGHAEKIGTDSEKEVFKALDYCQKVGLKYFVRDIIAEEYVSLGHREYPDYRTLTAEQKQNLNQRFIVSLAKYKDHPAFYGISFYDEPGVDSFPAIAVAKEIFEKECPDKIFYVNNLPNNCSEKALQYGCNVYGVPEGTNENLFTTHSNADRYLYFMEKYFEIVKPHLYSYDSYPFLTLGNAHTMVHISLYEIQQICTYMQSKYGVPYWTFMQIGGQWEGSACRITDLAEMLLQVNISLAYGAKGIQLFPCCFPNDWYGDKVVDAGAFDMQNNETLQYHYLKIALKQLKACEYYMSQASLKGVRLAGEFSGMLPPEEELQKIEWNETIFRGVLPTAKSILKSDNCNPRFTASSQFFIGEFECLGKNLYYMVNNSITTSADIKIQFNEKKKFRTIYKGKETLTESDSASFYRVAPGDGIMLMLS